MKQCFYFALFICFILSLLAFPCDGFSQKTAEPRSIEPRIIGKYPENYKIGTRTWCVNLHTGEKVPCSFKVKISKAHDEENCTGGANAPCGHVDRYHIEKRSEILQKNDPDNSEINTETVRILGGLTDAWESTPKTFNSKRSRKTFTTN